MDIEIKVPSLGESESEATLVTWLKKQGDAVEVDEVLAEIESDKITLEIAALDAGILKDVHKQAGETVVPGEVIALIEEGRVESGEISKQVTVETADLEAMPRPAKGGKEANETGNCERARH